MEAAVVFCFFKLGRNKGQKWRKGELGPELQEVAEELRRLADYM